MRIAGDFGEMGFEIVRFGINDHHSTFGGKTIKQRLNQRARKGKWKSSEAGSKEVRK
jgi:hypothetical protein